MKYNVGDKVYVDENGAEGFIITMRNKPLEASGYYCVQLTKGGECEINSGPDHECWKNLLAGSNWNFHNNQLTPYIANPVTRKVFEQILRDL